MEITGRVTANATVHTLKDERKVVNFSIAVNDYYKPKSGEKKSITEYIQCAYWISSSVAKALTKGALVQLYGRISADAWIGADGEARAALRFHTSDIKFLAKASATVQGNAAMHAGNPDDDLPF